MDTSTSMDTSIEFCMTCEKLVKPRNNAITCDKCQKWNHLRCNTGITYYMYKKALKGQHEIEWICTPCKEQSSFHLENQHTEETTETSVNASLSVETIETSVNAGHGEDIPTVITQTPVRANTLSDLNTTYVVSSPIPTLLNSPNLQNLQDISAMSIENVNSFHENNLVGVIPVPEDEPAEEPQSTNYRIVARASGRGKDLLVDSVGFTYTMDYEGKHSVRWQCSVRSKTIQCSAAVKYNKDTATYVRTEKDHLCSPKVTALVNAEVRNTIRSESEARPFASASNIVNSAINEHLPSTALAATLPKPDSYTRIANRRRQGNMPTNLKELHFTIQSDHIPEGFLQGDVYAGLRRHLIFYTLFMCTFLSNAKTWYVDATFKAISLPFKQLWVIHGFLKQGATIKQVPLAFVFMSGKRKEDYVSVLEYINGRIPNLAPKVVMDFEADEWEAFRTVFPSTTLQGCVFYWTQAVWRKVQQCGLSELYKKKSNIYHFIRRLMCLPFLPSNHIERTFNSFKAVVNANPDGPLSTLLNYIEGFWLHNSTFPVDTWSAFDQHIRTNNDTEGWNHRLNTQINRPSMNFYQLVKLLWDEAGLLPTQAQLVSEELLQRHQRTSSLKRENGIQLLFEKLKKTELSPNGFLSDMSKIHGPRERN